MYAYTKHYSSLKSLVCSTIMYSFHFKKAENLKQRNISLKLSILETLMLQQDNMIEQIKSYCDQLESMNFLVDLEAICQGDAAYLTDLGLHEESTYFWNKALSLKTC
ncbi:hypothetical protein ACEQPO_28515 [Bacillus sp. SL00103]